MILRLLLYQVYPIKSFYHSLNINSPFLLSSLNLFTMEAFTQSKRNSSFSSLSSVNADLTEGIQLPPIRRESGLFDISWDTTNHSLEEEDEVETLLRPFEKSLSADSNATFDFDEFLNEKELGRTDRLSSSTLGSLDTNFQQKDFFSSDSDVAFSTEEIGLPTANALSTNTDWVKYYGGVYDGMPGGFESLYPASATTEQWSADMLTGVTNQIPIIPQNNEVFYGIAPAVDMPETEWYSTAKQYQTRYPLSATLQHAGGKSPTKSQTKKQESRRSSKGTLPTLSLSLGMEVLGVKKYTGIREMRKQNDTLRAHIAEAKACRDREELESGVMMETLNRLMSSR